MDNKKAVLIKIAQKMNESSIVWNLGGSCMLYMRGIIKEFNDIDIVVSEANVESVRKIMSSLGTLMSRVEHKNYKTTFFLEYTVDGIDVDIISGFTIAYNNKDHYFPLFTNEGLDVIEINKTQIYLEHVSVWLHYYTLMERTEKVNLIEAFLSSK